MQKILPILAIHAINGSREDWIGFQPRVSISAQSEHLSQARRISGRRAVFPCRWREPSDFGCVSCKEARRATQGTRHLLICVALWAWVPARIVSGG
jgi:hypothetical protein